MNEKALDLDDAAGVAVALGVGVMTSAGVDSDVGFEVGLANPRKSNARESLLF